MECEARTFLLEITAAEHRCFVNFKR